MSATTIRPKVRTKSSTSCVDLTEIVDEEPIDVEGTVEEGEDICATQSSKKRQKRRNQLMDIVHSFGLRRVQASADGHCLYRSLSKQLVGREFRCVSCLRILCVKHLQSSGLARRFGVDLEDVLNEKWADAPEIAALARGLAREIVVIHETKQQRFHSEEVYALFTESEALDGIDGALTVIYNGHDHYDAAMPPKAKHLRENSECGFCHS
jgi:hypothetical protein